MQRLAYHDLPCRLLWQLDAASVQTNYTYYIPGTIPGTISGTIPYGSVWGYHGYIPGNPSSTYATLVMSQPRRCLSGRRRAPPTRREHSDRRSGALAGPRPGDLPRFVSVTWRASVPNATSLPCVKELINMHYRFIICMCVCVCLYHVMQKNVKIDVIIHFYVCVSFYFTLIPCVILCMLVLRSLFFTIVSFYRNPIYFRVLSRAFNLLSHLISPTSPFIFIFVVSVLPFISLLLSIINPSLSLSFYIVLLYFTRVHVWSLIFIQVLCFASLRPFFPS